MAAKGQNAGLNTLSSLQSMQRGSVHYHEKQSTTSHAI